ncbi:contractile injection system protein, VgrG/Pvc8 family [Methylobacterium indicum]|uniref:contractile injection system protein, VgrG/Pvc8 family n=1 Tax=Methylobacterium indicum TaxID=1775910 RepID=UPI003B969D50
MRSPTHRAAIYGRGHLVWFRHERDKHTLVGGDHPSAYDERDRDPGSSDAEHIHDWRRQLSFTPGRRAGNDYEFLTPNLDLTSDTPSIDRVPETRLTNSTSIRQGR